MRLPRNATKFSLRCRITRSTSIKGIPVKMTRASTLIEVTSPNQLQSSASTRSDPTSPLETLFDSFLRNRSGSRRTSKSIKLYSNSFTRRFVSVSLRSKREQISRALHRNSFFFSFFYYLTGGARLVDNRATHLQPRRSVLHIRKPLQTPSRNTRQNSYISI